MDAGAWGLSTSQFDVDAHGRPVPSRAADDAELDALLDVLGAAGQGVVEIVPRLLDVADPFALLEDLARRCGARGVPLTWTGFTYNEANLRACEKWLDLVRRLRGEGIALLPQLSPRPVDLRLSWDSSMMFMGLPEGWHRVIAARGRGEGRPPA